MAKQLKAEILKLLNSNLPDWDSESSFDSQCDDLASMLVETVNEAIESDALDTVKACLLACGGSKDLGLLEQQCNAAGKNPSEFIRQTGGRLMQLIEAWDANGRDGHSLPVIPVELIWDIEQILAGDARSRFFPRLEDEPGYTQENHEPSAL